MPTPVRSALLRGPEHAVLGGIAAIAEDAVAIALSQGGAAKRYPHREPNEDVAGFVWSEWGAVLAVADGHQGSDAACLALERAIAHAPRWLERSPIALDARFGANAEALVRGIQQQIVSQLAETGSRTTLALALARPREGWLGLVSVGDSLLFTHGPAGTRWIRGAERANPTFLGTARLGADELAKATFVDLRPLRGERAVVLATDGFSQPGIGVADPEKAIALAAQDAARVGAERASLVFARGIVERALESQKARRSGDNVATAVLWLAGWQAASAEGARSEPKASEGQRNDPAR